jgi:3-hydroxybutyryl-CoA dehydrogenase
MDRICVVGMGTMGSQIGVVCARAGFATSLVDTSEERTRKGMESIRSFLQTQEKKGKMTREAINQILPRISSGTEMTAASEATW